MHESKGARIQTLRMIEHNLSRTELAATPITTNTNSFTRKKMLNGTGTSTNVTNDATNTSFQTHLSLEAHDQTHFWVFVSFSEILKY